MIHCRAERVIKWFSLWEDFLAEIDGFKIPEEESFKLMMAESIERYREF